MSFGNLWKESLVVSFRVNNGTAEHATSPLERGETGEVTTEPASVPQPWRADGLGLYRSSEVRILIRFC